ncbi:MAG: KH domain-containing protein [Candidatus Cloacimonetes bacterium]|nr:KH domain-containing protein [Candidatus Cloacimonadota bacterium]
MKKLLEFIAKSILEHPKDIKVTEEEDKEAGIVRLKLSVHPEDIGRAIGKQGRIANAIRNLLRVIAIREGKRVFLDIETPEEKAAEKPTEATEKKEK